MEWTKFNTHGESSNHAFEVMCNILFETWCKKEYKEELKYFSFVNGSGGDGGIESYGILNSGDVIGVQAKWFPDKMESAQFAQIKNSFNTAVKVRSEIKRYIVCIPRDLTSKKITSGGKIAKNTEENKWLELVGQLKATNPSASVELWDETTIQGKLMQPEARGCYKYWFENTAVFEEEIIDSYNKAVNGWARTKYIPDIYATGYIHEKLEEFTGNYAVVEKRYREILRVEDNLKKLKKAYEDILELKFPEKEKALVEKISLDIKKLSEWISQFESIKLVAKVGSDIREDFLRKRIDLNCTEIELKENSMYFQHYFHFAPAIEVLKSIEIDFFMCGQRLKDTIDNCMVFLGDQGTGKTAGILAETSVMLQQRTHLPILVHAKDFSVGDTWLSILLKTLGMSSKWDERELFRALENAALLRKRREENNKGITIQPKCLICVDGIDEATSWDFWQERINEVKVYEKDFSGIKFVFLSRPYVFKRYKELKYRDAFFYIPSHGDVSVAQIFDQYIEYYNVNLDGNIWIKNMLKTPMALKLFCDRYRNTKIGLLSKNSMVITNLLKEKINSIEDIYRKSGKETDSQSMVRTVLVCVATMLADKKEILYEDIYNQCKELVKPHLEEILKFVEEEGFISSRLKQQDEFSECETVYSWGMQPAFDYLMARKIFDAVKESKEVEIHYTNGIYQMLSLVLLEEGNLISEYPNIKLDKDTIFDLNCYALNNTSIEVAEKYQDDVKKWMNQSVNNFRMIFNKVILPSSDNCQHPLGSKILDEFLRGFEKPAQRDIWWSIPAGLQNELETAWGTYIEIDTNSVKLISDEEYWGRPMILAWNLSCVDNRIRYECRQKLIEWGINNPDEFLKLLMYCADINDEQIIEDLFSIAYGIALGKNVKDEYLKTLSIWIMKNVFSNIGLVTYENIVVRYYCRGIVKRAIDKDLYKKEAESQIMPPYQYQMEIMPACQAAFKAEKMSGYGPINYDFSRYVLCDELNKFFKIDHKTQEYFQETQEFIEEYRKKYNLETLKWDGLLVSVVYQYLIEQGWEQKLFGEYRNKRNIGVDIAIKQHFYQATHGRQSSVMTIAEKYVWCAKHRVEVILANKIPIQEDNESRMYVKDYAVLDSFVNTYQDYIGAKKREQKSSWLNTDQMVCCDVEEYSVESIEAWVKQGDVPDFSKWIENNDEMLIYGATSLENEQRGIDESVWISSGIVKREKLEQFIKALNIYSEGRQELFDVTGFHARQADGYYCTPQEACTVRKDKEVESNIFIETDDNVIKVDKMVDSCNVEDVEETEKSFYLPSRMIRTLTGITYGDGYEYSNSQGEIIGRYADIKEGWKNSQEYLLMKSEILRSALEKNQYEIFWLFEVFRSPSYKAYERFDNEIMHDTDRNFVVWMKEGEYKFMELQSIESPQKEMDKMLSSKFNYLLPKEDF